MNTPETLDKQFEQAWISLAPALAGKATLKEICELFWLKGRCAGLDAGMELVTSQKKELSPEEEAKLASVTISERFDHAHLGEVLKAQKELS